MLIVLAFVLAFCFGWNKTVCFCFISVLFQL